MPLLTGLEHIARESEPLAPHIWLKLGGAAQYFAEPTTGDELKELVDRCHQEDIPIRLLGGGSNLVVHDEGVPGLVVSLSAPVFGEISISGTTAVAGGGARLSHVISSAVREGLGGLEPLSGVPGTVGGALHGNSCGGTTDVGQWLQQATVLTRTGEFITRARDDMQFAYRQSSLNELAILQAKFELEPENPAKLTRRLQKLWIVKRSRQPSGERGAICMFKDPQGMSARELIEQADLKNTQVGGVCLFERDPNFLVVSESVLSNDIFRMVDRIRQLTSERTGIELENAFEIW